jgi:hypothetical protein
MEETERGKGRENMQVKREKRKTGERWKKRKKTEEGADMGEKHLVLLIKA